MQKRAKELVNDIMQQYYERARNAHQNGEKVGWVTANFPQEIIQAMDLCVVYPENHSALIGFERKDRQYSAVAENAGFSNNICSFARINIGDCLSTETEESIPRPDFLVCCTNVCCQLLKWFQYISKRFQVPLILLDIPYSTDYIMSDEILDYVKEQFYEVIRSLEEVTHKKFEWQKFTEVMKISNRAAERWKDIIGILAGRDKVYRGTILFNYMGVMVCQRGRQETVDALDLLYDELINKRTKTDAEEKNGKGLKIIYEGICCWPELMKLAISFESYGMNMSGAVYPEQFAVTYDSFEDMLKAYADLPNAVTIERGRDKRIELIRKQGADGILVHMSKTCKMWSGLSYEIMRQVEKELKIPLVVFEADHADSQCFSEAQYDTKIQGLYELTSRK